MHTYIDTHKRICIHWFFEVNKDMYAVFIVGKNDLKMSMWEMLLSDEGRDILVEKSKVVPQEIDEFNTVTSSLSESPVPIM